MSQSGRQTELADLRKEYALLAADLKEESARRFWDTVRREEYFEPPKGAREGGG